MSDHIAAPRSDLLSDCLRARRAEVRPKARRRQTDFGPIRQLDNDMLDEPEEAPNQPSQLQSNARISSISTIASSQFDADHGVGLRDVEQQLEKLSKLNFDLKLEVHHRRQREDKLTEKVNALADQLAQVDLLRDEHRELLGINDSLVKELEKRDAAIREAVDIICSLETERDAVKQQHQVLLQSQLQHLGVDITVQTPRVTPPSPARTSTSPRRQSTTNSRPAQRQLPDILADSRHTTGALRNAYLDPARNLKSVKSFLSMLSEHDTEKGQATPRESGTPRLGVMSDETCQQQNTSITQTQDPRQDSIKRVNNWISTTEQEHPSPSHARPSLHRSAASIDARRTGPSEHRPSAHMLLKAPQGVSRVGSSDTQSTNHSEVTASTTTELDPERPWYSVSGAFDTGTPGRSRDGRVNASSILDNAPKTKFERDSSSTTMGSQQTPMSTTKSLRRPPVDHGQFMQTPDRKSTRSSLNKMTDRLFRRRSEATFAESPMSTNTSYFSESTSSAKQAPSTAATTYSSTAQPSSHIQMTRDQSRSQTLSDTYGVSRTDSHRSKSPHAHSASESDRPEVTRTIRRRSAISPAARTRLPTAQDLSRNSAKAAWDGSVSPAPALARSTSSRVGVGKLLGLERRLSKA